MGKPTEIQEWIGKAINQKFRKGMMNMRTLMNEMELKEVTAGYLGFLFPIVKKIGTTIVKKLVTQEKENMEGLADIRMRAGDNALKAAMRLNRQEADIREAMKAQREALGLD